jgi:GntR family transcriptional regulator, transcriptional repressor for pyruvate dehydrogenase complex
MGRDDTGSPSERMATAAALPNIRQIARTQQVREQIEAAIERGDYRAGDRLPSERELGEMIGVSRVSVREAIRSLEALGLVEVQHGRGCFVTQGPGDEYASSFGRWLTLHRDEVMDLMKVRGALDALAAEAAARHADDAMVARLHELNAAFNDARAVEPADVAQLIAADKAFHNGIAEASGSPLLATLLGELRDHIDRSRALLLGDPQRARASAREHQAVVEAIAARDPVAAGRAAGSHIDRICAFLAEAGEAAAAGRV